MVSNMSAASARNDPNARLGHAEHLGQEPLEGSVRFALQGRGGHLHSKLAVLPAGQLIAGRTGGKADSNTGVHAS
jgi:hypothetical protein